MKILVFGGNGLLGSYLKGINGSIITPTSHQVNVKNFDEVNNEIEKVNPDLVINAAAFIDNRKIEKDPTLAVQTNIIGSANISLCCFKNNIRLVYISTDYIYKGDRGNYKETDEILPFNLYAWTKLGGECSTQMVKNNLIIRTSFGSSNFNYKYAFNDKYASKDYVEVIAPMIYEAATSTLIGVLNLGTERKTLYDYAKQKNDVLPQSIKETFFRTPEDTSLNLQKWIDYKSIDKIAESHKNCRCCGSSDMTKYLDLGVMPLANNLEYTSTSAKNKERFPLQILFCNHCALSQLSVVINPSKMFSYYTYRSSINGGYVKHCNSMAKTLSEKYSLNSDSFIIDVAGNDGALLEEFKKVFNPFVLNIDPATNLTAIAEQRGVKSLNKFWNINTSKEVVSNYGKADLITATNVFAHVDNITDFLSSAKEALNDKGVLVLEFPYLIDFIENKEYDTTYFEHLSYVLITPINKLCATLGLSVIDVSKQNIHGGTVRVSISQENAFIIDESVSKFLENESKEGYLNLSKYLNWSKEIENSIKDFSENILNLKLQGYSISAFGASAKGNTLLNSCNINTDVIDYIVDETPEKIGKFSPTTGIPIVNKQMIIDKPTDYMVILAWNFKDEIMNKLKDTYNGKFIIPVPNFSIIP